MPIIIPANQWDFDAERIHTGCSPNHSLGEMTTQDIIESLREIVARPEMVELNQLIKNSGQFARGHHAHNQQH